MTRFFLDQDSACHWYLVPEERRAEWQRWRDLDDDLEESWSAPDFASAVGSGPEFVTFIDPQLT